MARLHEHKRLERIMETRTEEEFLNWISGASIYIGYARYGQLGGHGFVCVGDYGEDEILRSWVDDLNGGDHEALSAAQNITKMNCWLGNDRDPAKAMQKMLDMARQYYYYELNDGKT